MPTIFSHAIFAAAAGRSFLNKSVSGWFWVLTAICAVVPDADVITRNFGVERGSMLSHRGLTHSIFFALLFGGLAAACAQKFLKIKLSFAKLFVFFALATFSHPLLDMLTNGGSGVALFAPLSSDRFAFPWRPIEVSPIGLGFFSARGVTVILSEFVWVWLPALVLLTAAIIIQKLRRR